MKITNTVNSKRNLFEALPTGIEIQEARGQQELVRSSQLPKELGAYDGDSKSTLEEHGIKVLGETKDDPLFYDVELPNGWKIEATDHSMWSKLFNANGDEVAAIFYKAAFYDRKAHICFLNPTKRKE